MKEANIVLIGNSTTAVQKIFKNNVNIKVIHQVNLETDVEVLHSIQEVCDTE
jgi:hypothetical protein